MKYLLLIMAFFSLCCPLRARTVAAFSDQEIVVTSTRIRLQVTERALHEVLHQIHQMTDIRFSLPYEMRAIPITTTIEAPDWPTVVRQLLRSFNTAEVWNTDNTALRRVFILGRGHMQAPQEAEEMARSQDGDDKEPEGVNTYETPPPESLPPIPPPPPPLEIKPQPYEDGSPAPH